MLLRVGLLGILLVGASSMAATFAREGTYKGQGMWKSPDGSTGTWNNEIVVVPHEKGAAITEKLTIVGTDWTDTQEVTWNANGVGNGFFDIVMADKSVGTGSCYESICQIEFQTEGERSGEVFHFGEDGVGVAGWANHSTRNHRVAWLGMLQRQ